MLDPWFKRTYPLKHAKKWLYWPWGEYRVLRDAAAVLFTCEEERILAGRSFWLYKANEVVVNYGTARPRGEPCSQISTLFDRFPHLRGKRLALFMGRIHPKKGLDLVIEAFARVLSQDPVWHLVIAGPDEVSLRARLELRARRLNISDRITWTAMLSGDFKWGALHASEVFLLTSHQENFGIAVAEALACGLPVLISNKVNIWREVKNDGAGLVAEDDLQGACELLRSWVATSDEEKSVMAKRAQNCFNKRFEIQQSSRSLLSILGRIAAV
jgi:glycosyltransferase involved in cell wall biosynthesis